jgi:hypothetical protein
MSFFYEFLFYGDLLYGCLFYGDLLYGCFRMEIYFMVVFGWRFTLDHIYIKDIKNIYIYEIFGEYWYFFIGWFGGLSVLGF